MLIETYEYNNYGSIIFSKNKFDFLTNFVIVDKSNPEITKNLDFKEISTFINKPVKKNLILYRLLTNDEDLDPFSSKIGFFIKLEKKIEIVYFDPIFILKDLEFLKITLPKDEFMFKIQQVGYKTKTILDESVIYEEHFCVDLSDDEAKNQNDSIFAETMLSLKNSSLDLNKEKLNKPKLDMFKNAHPEMSKRESKFYNLEKFENYKNNSYPKRETKIVEVKDDSDFFKRVSHKKSKKEDYKSSTLKMFR
ncbi:MAG: hypothetical protein L3J41_12680 [Melioribacteraceae bacterium]|nr:hypothetical protein [Melioribacteraceae bacterium]